MGGPATLAELGVENEEKIRQMAEAACRFGSIGGLKVLNADDVEAIYRLSM